MPNSGVTEADYTLFFQGFFDASWYCDIADDSGRPLQDGRLVGSVAGVENNGVTEGDYNLFFAEFFNGAANEDLGGEWGVLSHPDTNNRIGYAGYWWDERVNMYVVRNRWYTPRTGRWLTPDPIGYAGGRNLYEYCNSQPWEYTDPMGLERTRDVIRNLWANDPATGRTCWGMGCYDRASDGSWVLSRFYPHDTNEVDGLSADQEFRYQREKDFAWGQETAQELRATVNQAAVDVALSVIPVERLAEPLLAGAKFVFKEGGTWFKVLRNGEKVAVAEARVVAKLEAEAAKAAERTAVRAEGTATATAAAKPPVTPPAAPCPGCPTGSAQAKGAAAEQRVEQALGVPRNTGPGRETVPGTGPGGIRIPDFPPSLTVKQFGTVIEVKDHVGTLKTTPQLQDLLNYAKANNATLTIYTNAPLPQSGWLADRIKALEIIIKPIP